MLLFDFEKINFNYEVVDKILNFDMCFYLIDFIRYFMCVI